MSGQLPAAMRRGLNEAINRLQGRWEQFRALLRLRLVCTRDDERIVKQQHKCVDGERQPVVDAGAVRLHKGEKRAFDSAIHFDAYSLKTSLETSRANARCSHAPCSQQRRTASHDFDVL